MSDVAGLMILVSNYEFANIAEDENELEVTTIATVQPTEAIKLTELGWVRRDSNKFAYIKNAPADEEEVMVVDYDLGEPNVDEEE